jgi:hypothetical protein
MKSKTKLKFSILILIFSTFSSFAQNEIGEKLFSVGVGINSQYGVGIPIGVSFENFVGKYLSVGGSINYVSATYYGDNKFKALYIGSRGSYHVTELLNLSRSPADLYVGATLGYRIFSWNDTFYGGNIGGIYGNGVYFGGFLGGRYYFTDSIAGFLEFGAGGFTNANLGLTLKF